MFSVSHVRLATNNLKRERSLHAWMKLITSFFSFFFFFAELKTLLKSGLFAKSRGELREFTRIRHTFVKIEMDLWTFRYNFRQISYKSKPNFVFPV